ncbi:hypothetical protein [Paenibacillus sp. y28]|uniref:hypothetical protein n=1 Tax=Paenibacillus sp. y28 TaxID=3129110 RepID=UPI00301B1296
MSSLIPYYILFAVIMLIALVATIMVGVSKKNREGNPRYDQKTKANWSRLSWIYLIITIACVIALIVYINA